MRDDTSWIRYFSVCIFPWEFARVHPILIFITYSNALSLNFSFQILTRKKIMILKIGFWVQGTVIWEMDSYTLYFTMHMNTLGRRMKNCIFSIYICCAVSKGSSGILLKYFKLMPSYLLNLKDTYSGSQWHELDAYMLHFLTNSIQRYDIS